MSEADLDCAGAAPLLARQALGTLEEAERAALRQHLQDCEACRATLEATVGAAADGVRARRREEAEHEAIRSAVRRTRALGDAAAPRPWLRPGVLARVLVPLGLLGLLRVALQERVGSGPRIRVEVGQLLLQGARLGEGETAPVGAGAVVRLEPGAQVQLAAGTTTLTGSHPLEFSLDSAEPLTVTLLEGRVEVDGPGRLRVDAGVAVLEEGAAAQARALDAGLEVECVRGVVNLRSATRAQVLAPGERAVLELSAD